MGDTSSEAGWLDQELRDQQPVKVAEDAAKRRKKAAGRAKIGRPVVKGFEVDLEPRRGPRGPLVMVYGSGPRQGGSCNVPLSREIESKVEKYGVGPKSQILALLIEHGLAQLEESGQVIVARSIKE